MVIYKRTLFYLIMKNSIFATKALSNTVSVSNLDFSENEETIKSYFSKAGEISNIRLIRNKKNQSKGLAYVTYENAEDALTAVNMLHYTILNGKQLTVKFYKERKKSSQAKESQNDGDNDKIVKKIDALEKELDELKDILKSKKKSDKKEQNKSLEFTNLVPVGQSWKIELPHRNWMEYEGKRYVVETSSVNRIDEGNSYPYHLFNGLSEIKNGRIWATDPDQYNAFITIIFPVPVVANVLTMMARDGDNSQQAPTSFEVVGVTNGTINSLKKFNKVAWAPNSQATFTFSNRKKFSEYTIYFSENNCQQKSFGLAQLNLGTKK